MSANELILSDAELCAFVDGEATELDTKAITAWLDAHEDTRARLEIWRKQAQLLRAHFAEDERTQVVAATRVAKEKPAPARASSRTRRKKISRAISFKRFATVSALSAAVAAMTVSFYIIISSLISQTGSSGADFFGRPSLKVQAIQRAAAEIVTQDPIMQAMVIVNPQRTLSVDAIYVRPPIRTPLDIFRYASEAHFSMGGPMQLHFDVASSDYQQLHKFMTTTIGADIALPICPKGLRPVGVRAIPGENGLAGYLALQSEASDPVGVYVTRAGSMSPSPPVLFEDEGLSIVTYVTERAAVAVVSRMPPKFVIEWAEKFRASMAATHV